MQVNSLHRKVHYWVVARRSGLSVKTQLAASLLAERGTWPFSVSLWGGKRTLLFFGKLKLFKMIGFDPPLLVAFKKINTHAVGLANFKKPSLAYPQDQ